ncbi:MAG: hypothetical protein HUJ22_08745 [Gracilimonas sp.]|uniref:hypothetical protein n=1 Tax=Gracilimonas sp. TaxID=1974203 RepID=UPI0019A795C6|nr:hypothetical protein [Gracilimonas sp.]MBD3616648.1 hypothetical protein [Gracilimonas sp.]
MTNSESNHNKRFKFEAQQIRVEEETKMRSKALRSVVNQTNRKLQKERSGSNGHNSSNLAPA